MRTLNVKPSTLVYWLKPVLNRGRGHKGDKIIEPAKVDMSLKTYDQHTRRANKGGRTLYHLMRSEDKLDSVYSQFREARLNPSIRTYDFILSVPEFRDAGLTKVTKTNAKNIWRLFVKEAQLNRDFRNWQLFPSICTSLSPVRYSLDRQSVIE